MTDRIEFRGCAIDGELAQAVLDVRQTLADHVADVRAKVALAQPPLTAIVATQVAAFKTTVAPVFQNSTVKTQQGFLQKIGVPTAPAGKQAIERALVPYGVVIVDGKIIPLAPGSTLSQIRDLWNRLDQDLPTTKTLLRNKVAGDFISVVRYFDETTVVTSDTCGDNSTTVTEEKLGGVDVAGIDVALQFKVPIANVRYHVFWINEIGATRANLFRLQRLGFLPAEIQSILSGSSTATISVTVIDDKTLIDRLETSPVTALSDVEVSELLARTDVANVSTTFDTAAVTKAIRNAIRQRPPSRNPAGFRNHQSPAVLLAQSIDVRRSFNIDSALAQIPATPPGMGAIGAVTDAAVTATQAGLGAIAGVADSLNQVFEMIETADNLIDISPLDVILCILGLDLSFGISISLDALIALILAALAAFRAIIGLIIAALNAIVDMMCFILSILNGILAFALGGLACLGLSVPQLNVPDFLKALVQAIIDALQAVQQVVEEIVALVLRFLSFAFALSFSLKAKAAQQTSSCMAASGIVLRIALTTSL